MKKASISRARCSPGVPARRTCGWRSPTSNCWRPCPSRGRCAMRCRLNDTSASRRAECWLWRRARPAATVLWPRYSEVMDYELEVGIVTRRTRANIPADEAATHIFGYTIFNDFSARDRQRREMQGRLGPAKGKSFDGGNALGPWIVTPDELGDPETLKV